MVRILQFVIEITTPLLYAKSHAMWELSITTVNVCVAACLHGHLRDVPGLGQHGVCGCGS